MSGQDPSPIDAAAHLAYLLPGTLGEDREIEEAIVALGRAERAEARSQVLAELRRGVEGLPGYRDPRYSGQFEAKGLVGRAAVLSLIKRMEADK